MKIAIIGTRGIPNNYGGFEQFAEYLSVGLLKYGHEVIVYSPHNHRFSGDNWQGVTIIHKYDPEREMGTMGQFIYDFNCILDTRRRGFDIVLQLGYTSSSVWGWLLPRKKATIITNMDGLEWKRSKFSKKVRNFLIYAEKLGVKYSDHLIADSIGIQEYIHEKYNRFSEYIPYGSHIFSNAKETIIEEYNLIKYEYNILVARLEPENSIEIILDGVVMAENKSIMLVIGNNETSYGAYLKNKFAIYKNIKFIGGIYDINILNNLRYFSNVYFHGHTVGGTNPSLLEAMGSNCLICANNNSFNNYILGDDGLRFDTAKDVALIINTANKLDLNEQFKLKNNLDKIRNIYSWDKIISQYEECFRKYKKLSEH